MKVSYLRYSWLLGLLLITIGSRAHSEPVPFDASKSPSEQLGYAAMSPQILGSATADSLIFAYQVYESEKPTQTMLQSFRLRGSTYSPAWTIQLPLPRLVGMTTDGSNFYLLSAAHEDLGSDTNPNAFRPNILLMTKVDKEGRQLWQRDLNNASYLGDNKAGAIYSPMTSGSGSISYGAGKVIVALATHTAADPNINARHQRAQYFVVGADGSGFAAASETSWRHSFDQRLHFDGQDFIFTDLADAGWYMPGGGITVRKIRPTAQGAEFIGDQENKQGTYIYVRQAETAGNQNFTFTSIGGLEQGEQGYLALFTSEVNNFSVSRNGWLQPVTEPRNLGLVHVTKNFEQVREGKWNGGQTLGNTIIQTEPISINISRSIVDSIGASQTFQRADKPSKSFTQTGIVWLTQLPPGTSAERSKIAKLANGRYIALWEEWSYSGSQLSHKATQGMLINEQGQILNGPVELKTRLNPSGADRLFIKDGRASWLTADAESGNFNLYTVDANLLLSTTTIDPKGRPQNTVFTDHLKAGDTLKPGDKLQSSDKQFVLIYQADGNLALYAADGRFLWNSGVHGPAGYASMQSDGNFAIYGPDGRFQWNTGTTVAGSRLVLQNDGNLVIATAAGAVLWSTSTAQLRDRLQAGQKLNPGDKLQSSNGLYSLRYQNDGNLVLYSGNSSILWSSGTGGRAAGYAVMQTDGNFAIYGPDHGFQWNTGTVSPGSWIVLQTDGNLVIYSADGKALWASQTAQ